MYSNKSFTQHLWKKCHSTSTFSHYTIVFQAWGKISVKPSKNGQIGRNVIFTKLILLFSHIYNEDSCLFIIFKVYTYSGEGDERKFGKLLLYMASLRVPKFTSKVGTYYTNLVILIRFIFCIVLTHILFYSSK